MMTTRKNPGVGAKHVDGAAKRPPKYLATKCMYYKVAFVPMEYTKTENHIILTIINVTMILKIMTLLP